MGNLSLYRYPHGRGGEILHRGRTVFRLSWGRWWVQVGPRYKGLYRDLTVGRQYPWRGMVDYIAIPF